MLNIGAIVWGVRDLHAAIQFWSEALDYRLKYEPDEDWAILIPKKGTGIQLSISVVTSDSQKHQRHHLDLFTDSQETEVERLLQIGASKVDWEYEIDADYIVLADPDGNKFCVVQDDNQNP
ncbi:VOC family protein [Alteribacillus sp. HJP-4]|uniref:VOC family protein n=1 Tax=Alteribacillus sp. HJP-4 TaxID=2775394 RepID=UPI0035CD30FE